MKLKILILDVRTLVEGILKPLYIYFFRIFNLLSVESRFSFVDDTLDIVHTTELLGGWIGVELLQFMLYDWVRVL